MRRLLLFVLMCVCVSIGAQAYVLEKNYGDGKTVSFSDVGSDTQRLTVGAGGLAEWFNDTEIDHNSLTSNADRTKLVITGTLNADDIAAIKTYFGKFTTVDMEGATLEEGASVNGMQLPNAEYMALPHGTPIADMKALSVGCPKLKAVAATDAASPTQFTGYSWAAGEIWNICQTGLVDGISSGICANTMQKLTIGGNVDDRDASTLSSSQYNTSEKSEFKSGASATYFVNGESVSVSTDYLEPTHSGGACSPWLGGTEIELDFSEALFDNYGDLALVSADVTELLLPNDPNFTEIKPYMFANLKKLRHIIVPNNIVKIGDAAYYCASGGNATEEISIGNGIKTIGNAAFATNGDNGRPSLSDIRFTPGISDVKILSTVFAGCNAIKHMMLPEGIISIGERCFNQLLELESVHFPTTLEYIGINCFRQTGLTMLTIPASVKVIDYNAFSLCRITDIYLMAENLSQLPYIYALPYDYTSQGTLASSTFDSNMLNGNNTTAPVSQHDQFASKNSQEAEELFRLSVTDGNTITKLHYNENLANFIDLNPWYYEGQTTPKPNSNALAGQGGNGGINEAKQLSDTYYLVDNENKTYPAADAWDLSRPTWAAYFNSESHSWDADGNNTDYPKEAGTQAAYYDPATGVLSEVTENTEYVYKVLRKEGWRQFTFKAGDAGSEDITFHKQYDNVWYTMCFPFSLTDEQLESAFNAEYNIADFSGIEVIEENDKGNKEIVLHFNKIAKAKYYDQDHNEYQRVEDSKVVKVAKNGAKFNTYTYTRDGKNYTYTDTYSNKSYKTDGDDKIYYIDGYLAQAGHPYMIHPNLGTSEGQPSTMTHMVGINYFSKDPDVIDQLCKDRARSVDLGTGKGYEGVTYSDENASDIAVNTDNEITENFEQAAYSKYPDQTYSFVGNCNEYSASAPAMPSYANGGLTALPNIEDYVDAEYLPNGPVKAEQGEAPDASEVESAVGARMTEAPTEVINPDEDEDTYSAAFKTLYNTVRCENVYLGYIDGANRYANYTYGEDLIAYEFSDFFNNYSGYSYANRSTGHNSNCNYTELEAYLGAASQADITEKFATLKQLAQNYVAAKSAFAQYQIDLETYNANVAAWAAYDQALEDYNNYSEADAEAAYQEALSEYSSQVGDYNAEYQRVQSSNEAAVAAWRANVQQYAVYIPENAYFLSRKSGEYYTHFFREKASLSKRKAKGTGKWSRYSAVLIPNDAALNGVEVAQDPSAAKAYNMAFDEPFYAVEATEIEQIVEDAKEKGLPVKYVNVVVSIDGKVVRRDNTSLEGLPSGIYIVNGKKYYVK